MADLRCWSPTSHELASLATWYQQDGPDWTWLERFSHNSDARVWGIGNEAIRGISWWRVVAGEAELIDVRVALDARGQGLGGQLLVYTLAQLAQEGVARCHLEVRAGNAVALRLYRRHGFTQTGKRRDYYPSLTLPDAREDAILMACELSCEAGAS